MVGFTIASSRGLLREPKARRVLMIGAILVAATLALLGSTVLQGWLDPREHPVWFILFWLACAWMTLLAILLALFDLLLARAEVRAAKRAMQAELARAAEGEADADDS